MYLMNDDDIFGQYMQQQPRMQAKAQPSAAPALQGVSAAATPFMATPAGASVLVGSQFASQLLAQRAAEAQRRRQGEIDIAQNRGNQEQNAMQAYINNIRGALR